MSKGIKQLKEHTVRSTVSAMETRRYHLSCGTSRYFFGKIFSNNFFSKSEKGIRFWTF